MPGASNHDWVAVKAEYAANPAMSARTISEKYGIPWTTVRRRMLSESWTEAREEQAAAYAQSLSKAAIQKNAPTLLRELNEKQLKQNDELRYMLNAKLKSRDAAGKIVFRESVSITDLVKVVAAFGELYRLDRLALGASTDNIAPANTRESRLAEMSTNELFDELRRVRAQSPLIQ